MLPGYRHTDRYVRRVERRYPDDPMRLLRDTRYVLPVAVGQGEDGQWLLLCLSFGPPRGGEPMDVFYRLFNFINDPDNPENAHWRTLRVSSIPNPDKISATSVVIADSSAVTLREWLDQQLSRPLPPNFQLRQSLVDSDPERMLKTVGLHISSPEDPLEESPGEDMEGWGDEWAEAYEGEEEFSSAPEELEDEFSSAPEELEDEFSSVPEGVEEEFSPASEGVEEEPSPAPRRLEKEPSVPHEGLEVDHGQFVELWRSILANAQPGRLAERLYPTEKDEDDEWARLLRALLPTREAAIASFVIALLSLFFPPASLLALVLYGGRPGFRLLVGALCLSIPYLVFFVFHAPFAPGIYVPAIVILLMGFLSIATGLQRLYKRFGLKFELSKVARGAVGVIKRARRKGVAPGAGMAQPQTPVTMADVSGSVTDVLIILSLILFLIPPVAPLAVGLFLFCLNRERGLLAPWNLLSLLYVMFLWPSLAGNITTGWRLGMLAGYLISFTSPASPHDLNAAKVKLAPQAIRNWVLLLIRSPGAAWRYLWSDKPGKTEIQFQLPPLPRPIATALSQGAQADPSALREMFDVLSRAHIDALHAAAKAGRIPLPIRVESVEDGRFYTSLYRVSAVQPVQGLPLPPEAATRIVQTALNLITRSGVPEVSVTSVNQGVVIKVQRTHRITTDSPYAQVPVWDRPIISREKATVIVPIGRSYVYFARGEDERHYASGLYFSPHRPGHALIVAPSGSGKSVLVRSILAGIAAACEEYPIGVLYLEGKQESAGEEVAPPLLMPITFLSSGSDTILMMAFLASILDSRQRLLSALTQLYGRPIAAEQFAALYNGFPLLVILIDEFWALMGNLQAVSSLKAVSPQTGKEVKMDASTFVTVTLNRMLNLARALGVAMILTTQAATRDAISNRGVRANATPIVGYGVGLPQIRALLEGTAAQQIAALSLPYKGGMNILARYGFVNAGAPGAVAAFIDPEGNVILGGDSQYQQEMPSVDVFLPFYRGDIARASRAARFDVEKLQADIAACQAKGLLGDPPSIGWLASLGCEMLQRATALGYGKESLQEQVLNSQTSLDAEASQ